MPFSFNLTSKREKGSTLTFGAEFLETHLSLHKASSVCFVKYWDVRKLLCEIIQIFITAINDIRNPATLAPHFLLLKSSTKRNIGIRYAWGAYRAHQASLLINKLIRRAIIIKQCQILNSVDLKSAEIETADTVKIRIAPNRGPNPPASSPPGNPQHSSSAFVIVKGFF